MLQSAIWIAALLALVGGVAGNRSAWPLLGSLCLCEVLDRAGVSFNPVFWMMVDLLVVLAMITPHIRYRDCVIMALFLPAWALYQTDDPLRYNGTALIVIAQLLLTFPAYRATALVRRLTAPPDHTQHMEMSLA